MHPFIGAAKPLTRVFRIHPLVILEQAGWIAATKLAWTAVILNGGKASGLLTNSRAFKVWYLKFSRAKRGIPLKPTLPTGLHGYTVIMHTCGRLQYWTISATASVAAEQPQPRRATSTWSVLRTSLMNASSAFLRLHYKNALGSHGDNQLRFCCDFWLVCVLLYSLFVLSLWHFMHLQNYKIKSTSSP